MLAPYAMALSFEGCKSKKSQRRYAYYRSNVGWNPMNNLKINKNGNTFKNTKIVALAFKMKVVY